MPSIGTLVVDQWQGWMTYPEPRWELVPRSGLAGYGVGYDAEMIEPGRITTQIIIPEAQIEQWIDRHRALITQTLTVRDGTERVWNNTQVVSVGKFRWPTRIAPAGYVSLFAEWVLLPDIFSF